MDRHSTSKLTDDIAVHTAAAVEHELQTLQTMIKLSMDFLIIEYDQLTDEMAEITKFNTEGKNTARM
jgi:hypothetical protein